jgi:UDP-N-acetylmuramoylalanine-D-glutamate ligase
MLGGYQSNFDYTEVLETIRQYHSIHTLILFPNTIDDFRRHITTDDTRQVFDVASMQEAVDIAREHTKPNHICLLSPGAKSFSLWTSMSERGKDFQHAISTKQP